MDPGSAPLNRASLIELRRVINARLWSRDATSYSWKHGRLYTARCQPHIDARYRAQWECTLSLSFSSKKLFICLWLALNNRLIIICASTIQRSGPQVRCILIRHVDTVTHPDVHPWTSLISDPWSARPTCMADCRRAAYKWKKNRRKLINRWSIYIYIYIYI